MTQIPPGAGPGSGDPSEIKAQSDTIVIERFFGDGTPDQSFELLATPSLPLTLEIWNFSKRLWEGLTEDYYSVEGKAVSFINGKTVDPPEDLTKNVFRNVRITYQPQSLDAESELAIKETDGSVAFITLTGANPTAEKAWRFSPQTGRAMIMRIRAVLTVPNPGLAYTANSRVFELFETTIGPPAHPTTTSLFRDTRLQPNSYGEIVVKSNVQLGRTIFENINSADFGQIFLRLTALGGDGSSSETYEIIVRGIEMT